MPHFKWHTVTNEIEINKMMFIKQILRNWKRNKLFSFTAILSLTVGFACCNLLAAFVINEWQISNGSPDNERIVVLKTDNPMTLETTKEKSSYIQQQIPPIFKERYPEVKSFCRMQTIWEQPVFKSDNYKTNEVNLLQADKDINQFFTIPILAGDLQKTLSTHGEVAITESWAIKAFGSSDVLGKTFMIEDGNETSLQKITTVIDDSYTASFITFDVLFPLNEEMYFGGVTFLKLRDSESMASLQTKIDNDLKELPRFTDDCKYYLQTLHEYYFDKSETQTSWQFLLKRDSLFMNVGIFAALAILFIACFNYINLYMVRLFKSGTNNSIKVLLGANTWQLQKHILLESFIATIIGFTASLILVLLILPLFNQLFEAHLSSSFLLDKVVLQFYGLLIVLLTFIPAIFLSIKLREKKLSGLKPVNHGKAKAAFSNTMVSVQFGFSVLMIIAAIIYTQQLNFISETANINPNIIEIEASGISESKLKTFKEQATKLACVEASTITSTSFLNTWGALDDDGVPILVYNMDNDFLKVHNMVLTQGEGFTDNNEENVNQAIVNETLIKKYNLDSPIGQNIELLGKDIYIVGVVKDFYTEPFNVKVKPSMIQPYKPNKMGFNIIQAKLADNMQRQAALSELEKLWGTHFSDKPFSYSYPAVAYNALHKDHRKLADIISFFTIISFLLTGFGLFGIAWYIVEFRTKEIGIRKVNGAHISEVLVMLNKDFLKWVVIAFVIATPIAYYAMHKWLENFAYKTELSWWIFALAGLLALGIALLTVSFQSYKAAVRNPIESLRYE